MSSRTAGLWRGKGPTEPCAHCGHPRPGAPTIDIIMWASKTAGQASALEVARLRDELDYTEKGLAEWRDLALERERDIERLRLRVQQQEESILSVHEFSHAKSDEITRLRELLAKVQTAFDLLMYGCRAIPPEAKDVYAEIVALRGEEE